MEGSIDSSEKGSAARFNEGKPPLELVPIRFWRMWWDFQHALSTDETDLDLVLAFLQTWQEGTDAALSEAFRTFPLDHRPDVVKVLEFGAQKYAAWNWAKGQRWGCTLGSLLRHCEKILQGEILDDDSGLSHWGHIGCNLLFLLWFQTEYKEGDDRPPMGKDLT